MGDLLSIAAYNDQPLSLGISREIDAGLHFDLAERVVVDPQLRGRLRAARLRRYPRRAGFGSYARCAKLAAKEGYGELTAAIFEATETGQPVPYLLAQWVCDFLEVEAAIGECSQPLWKIQGGRR